MGPDRSEQAARRFTFADSELWMSADGAVSAVRHPVRDHSMLLEEDPEAPEAVMHDAARRWGKGFVVTDRGGHRFDAPAEQSWAADGVDLVHRWPGLDLNIGRHVGTSWSETYELRNTSETPMTIGSVGVSTPWRDVYSSSRDSLRRAVHAHLWTGGADSWVWCRWTVRLPASVWC